MQMLSRRRLLILLALLLIGGWIAWAARPAPIDVTVAEVSHGTVEKTVANTRAGTVEACRRAKLSPSAGGQIAKLPVHEGDAVKQGQLLLELWNEDLAAQLELAHQESVAATASAVASCIESDHLQRESLRQQALVKRQLVSEDRADQALSAARAAAAACEAAQAQAAVARARRGVAEATLQKTRLFAPFDGVVAEINGELSEYVTPSPIGIATPPAIDLIADGCFYLAAPIDEVDVAAISTGLQARITLDAFGKRHFAGHVRRIADYVLDAEKQARTVDVEVEFDNPADEQPLLAGYSADVEIILETRSNTLRIPSEALLEDTHVFVFDPKQKRIEQRKVRPGTANWDYTEILEGLSEGELVVTSVDREGLADGVAAQRVDTDE